MLTVLLTSTVLFRQSLHLSKPVFFHPTYKLGLVGISKILGLEATIYSPLRLQ